MTVPLLAIPPFPGARPLQFAMSGEAAPIDVAAVLAALATHKVGGCYWGMQPALPKKAFILDGAAAPNDKNVQHWPEQADPWHLLAGAAQVRLRPGDPRIILAAAAGCNIVEAGTEAPPTQDSIAALTALHIGAWRWRDPFSGSQMTLLEAIALCGFWRNLIDANRPIAAAMGFAHWKKPTAGPLLWAGKPVPFANRLPRLAAGQHVAIWRARLSEAQARALTVSNAPLVEVEDGFIRSAGLGADCVPPLSIIVDAVGVHFDPSGPSALEDLLQHGDFPPALLARAAALRSAIVAGGLSKYERGGHVQMARPGGPRRHVLVPGQVEDDRALTSGGALSSNLDLLKRAREQVGPDAFVIYKPHPDVMAGHRKGLVSEADMALLADKVEASAPMPALINMVDELHVNSSLAGFEALLRGKAVTVYGVPFYAGWGLTTDCGPVPARRTARRTLDELVAAALLLYPRYLDPETGLPCPAEVLVERLAGAAPMLDAAANAVVAVRRASGRVRRLFSRQT